jgi:hypothetical protein
MKTADTMTGDRLPPTLHVHVLMMYVVSVFGLYGLAGVCDAEDVVNRKEVSSLGA